MRTWCTVMALVAALGHGGLAGAEPASIDQLFADLRSTDSGRVDRAIAGLATYYPESLPGLAACLGDVAVRIGCAESLYRVPAEHSAPVLLKAIRTIDETNRRDRGFESLLIALVGRQRWQAAGPLFEGLYEAEDPRSARAMSLAWALEKITGKARGPARDPWLFCGTGDERPMVGPP